MQSSESSAEEDLEQNDSTGFKSSSSIRECGEPLSFLVGAFGGLTLEESHDPLFVMFGTGLSELFL
jgi:hypothetical protein